MRQATALPPPLADFEREIWFDYDAIVHGWIYLYIRTSSRVMHCAICNVEDSLLDFVQFARTLRDGEFPRARLMDRPGTDFIVEAVTADPGKVRLHIRQKYPHAWECFDIVIDRKTLLVRFRQLLGVIADVEALGLYFLCHGNDADISDDEFDRISTDAEAAWGRGVALGRYVDDEDDREQFVMGRVLAYASLTPQSAALVARYREALRTLWLPGDWADKR